MTTLWQTWRATAERHADRPAIIEADTGQSLTCAQLAAAAARAAEPTWHGRVVPFCLPNGIAWFVRFLAIQAAGGVAAALDPALAGAEAFEHTSRRLRTFHPPRGTCCLKLTSGTTGDLKIIACTARHLLADGEHIIRTMGLRRRDSNLAIIPVGHSYGLGNLVMPLLMQATPVVCPAGLVPRHLLDVIDRHGVTVLPTVPAVLRALALTPQAKSPASLRLVISAGAVLPADVAAQFQERFGLKIHNFYGSSETGGICYDRTGTATLSGRSVGKPMHGVTVRVRRDGRVLVRSTAVAMPGGSCTLPDRGEWTARGELRLVGRVGSIANIGGKKVPPAEVENALRGIAGVTDAWVTVLQDRRHHDYLAAAVESDRRQPELEAELARQLAAWKLPKRWIVQRTLPRTERGKLDTATIKRGW